MSSSLEAFLKRLRDPRWIPNISDYCDGRCGRCAFTERCWSFALRQYVARRSSPEPTVAESDPEVPPDAAYGVDDNDSDPLRASAMNYGTDVWNVMGPLMERQQDEVPDSALPPDVLEALRDVWSLSLTIGAKVHRAISSSALNTDEEFEGDLVQNDENGSAKVARVAIAESWAPWEIVRRSGLIDPGLLEYFVESLKRIDSAITERFPLAMAFVRPGFDEEIPGIVRPWSIMPDEDDEDEHD